ncbi:unnamed protein product [Pleuronectes platessa]|uniref:Uncharacterized protein n=1 Tax=Pleuronectes platessa TaxID=8262 RepID=A0A9N7UJZ7_PLEPL|nr:unnamed protein product [Pleuronectes platessa]
MRPICGRRHPPWPLVILPASLRQAGLKKKEVDIGEDKKSGPSQQAPKTWAPGHNAPLCPLTYGILAMMWPWKVLSAKSLPTFQIPRWRPMWLTLY